MKAVVAVEWSGSHCADERRHAGAGSQTSIQVGVQLRWEHPFHVLECSTFCVFCWEHVKTSS